VSALKNILTKKKGKIAALMMECVQGEGGFHDAPPKFFKALIKECKKNKVLIWIDEVQTFGRTKELFSSEDKKIMRDVDVITFGKLSQVCGVLYRKELNPTPGLLSQTFTGSTIALSIGQFMIQKLIKGSYYGKNGKIARIENKFKEYLSHLSKTKPGWIKNFTVVGSMVAFTPFDGTLSTVKKLVEQLYEKGLICFSCGHGPYRIRFLLPAPVLTNQEIKEGLKILEEVFSQYARENDYS